MQDRLRMSGCAKNPPQRGELRVRSVVCRKFAKMDGRTDQIQLPYRRTDQGFTGFFATSTKPVRQSGKNPAGTVPYRPRDLPTATRGLRLVSDTLVVEQRHGKQHARKVAVITRAATGSCSPEPRVASFLCFRRRTMHRRCWFV